MKIQLKNLNKYELQTLAKQLNIKGVSKLKTKAMLVETIMQTSNIKELENHLGIKQTSRKTLLKKIFSFSNIASFASVIGVVLAVYYGINSMAKKEIKKHFEILYEAEGGNPEVFKFRSEGSYKILEERYPYGFHLFGLSTENRLITGQINKESKMKIRADWEKLQANIDEKNEIIYLKIPRPNYSYKNEDNNSSINIDIGMLHTSFNLKEVVEPKIIPIAEIPGEPNMYFQLLENKDPFPVFVFGFKE